MRYPTLRLIAWVIRVLAWLILTLVVLTSCVLAAMVALGAGFNTGPVQFFPGVLGALLLLLGGFIYAMLVGLPLLALAELIFLFLDIERNTRETAQLLRERAA